MKPYDPDSFGFCQSQVARDHNISAEEKILSTVKKRIINGEKEINIKITKEKLNKSETAHLQSLNIAPRPEIRFEKMWECLEVLSGNIKAAISINHMRASKD
ncbi:CLUMA_CG000703, isoform A [Clunio marinus]|uniref:CLUMA_CG000703, isoform A n=1 Tax=Clunio marinus TaxID=568069 RepID=A0A1J1HK88_9DIPT|nr:CLUMA_CG000703, isoform A [Clunio marinus]